MRDAFSGIFNIVFVVLILVIIEGILGLIVSYTKAFKMKNAVIANIERYEGSGCDGSMGIETACIKEIVGSAKRIAYSPTSNNSCDGMEAVSVNGKTLYCFTRQTSTKNVKHSGYTVTKTYDTYIVMTQVDIAFPIINQIMGMKFFQVSGSTKPIQRPK